MKMGEYTALFNLRNGSDQLNAAGSWLATKEQMPFNRYEYCVDCSCADKNHGAIHTAVATSVRDGKFSSITTPK